MRAEIELDDAAHRNPTSNSPAILVHRRQSPQVSIAEISERLEGRVNNAYLRRATGRRRSILSRHRIVRQPLSGGDRLFCSAEIVTVFDAISLNSWHPFPAEVIPAAAGRALSQLPISSASRFLGRSIAQSGAAWCRNANLQRLFGGFEQQSRLVDAHHLDEFRRADPRFLLKDAGRIPHS